MRRNIRSHHDQEPPATPAQMHAAGVQQVSGRGHR
jgi:hypothetical protein